MTDTPKYRDSDMQPKSKPDQKISPAGTHDKPHLTDKDKTPGSGMLPDKVHPEVEGPTG